MEVDIELVVDGLDEFLPQATLFYEEYVHDMIGLMHLFGIRTQVWFFNFV